MARVIEVGDLYEGDFAYLYVLARYQNFLWIRVEPKDPAFKPSLKTMDKAALDELQWVANRIWDAWVEYGVEPG